MTDAATMAGVRVGPVLMSTPMVRATWGGWKTNTRRFAHDDDGKPTKWLKIHQRFEAAKARGETGYRELLWVREGFWQATRYPGTLPSGGPEPIAWLHGNLIHYAADGSPQNTPNRHYPSGLSGGAISAPDPYAIWARRPSIHMPRWASRLTLEVTATKLERLQDITEEDARAEGLSCLSKDQGRTWKYGLADRDGEPGNDDGGWRWYDWLTDYKQAFAALWDDLHGPGAWDKNPLVVCLRFTAHKANVDHVLKEMAG